MGGRPKQPIDPSISSTTSTLVAAAGVSSLWDEFREGRPVRCPHDAGPLALSVDGAAMAYRFVCVSCGAGSPWFESGAAGFEIRAGSTPLIPGSPLLDE